MDNSLTARTKCKFEREFCIKDTLLPPAPHLSRFRPFSVKMLTCCLIAADSTKYLAILLHSYPGIPDFDLGEGLKQMLRSGSDSFVLFYFRYISAFLWVNINITPNAEALGMLYVTGTRVRER